MARQKGVAMNIKGIRFYKVDAESIKDEFFTTIGVNLDLREMSFDGEGLRIDFTYSVDYKPSVAHLSLNGYVLLSGSGSDLERLENQWRTDRTLPKDVAESLINVITFNAETNGVFIAKTIGIVPPLIAPKIEIGPPLQKS
jgi:hypothetical protein